MGQAEVTPEMLAAGKRALWDFNEEDVRCDEIVVTALFNAMSRPALLVEIAHPERQESTPGQRLQSVLSGLQWRVLPQG